MNDTIHVEQAFESFSNALTTEHSKVTEAISTVSCEVENTIDADGTDKNLIDEIEEFPKTDSVQTDSVEKDINDDLFMKFGQRGDSFY